MKNPGYKRIVGLGGYRERAPRTGFEPVTLRESFRPKPEFKRLCSKRATTTDG